MEILKNVQLLRDHIMLKYDSTNTAKNYCSALTMFLVHFKDYPESKAVSDEKIIDYLLAIPGHSNRRTHHSAVKLFYKIKGQPHKFRFIPYPEKEDKLPIHVNKEEFFQMISVCDNEKHRLLITIMFDAGLRVSEVRNLKLEDIDTSNMVLNILRAKKKKDRKVKLSGIVLTMIKSYIITHKPNTYLFNGENLQYSVKSIQLVVKALCKKAGINKKFTPHKFRHGFAMTLLENGEHLTSIQNQMGHESPKTTEIYARINNKVIQKIESPVEQLLREKGMEVMKMKELEEKAQPLQVLPVAAACDKIYQVLFNGKQFELRQQQDHITHAPPNHQWTINKDAQYVLGWYEKKGYKITEVLPSVNIQ